jgi:RNA polymerase sigma factor (TIGR02999 family)
MEDVTSILKAIDSGDPSASEELLPLVYAELRRLAAGRMTRENPGQTLDATGLVHEAYLRLVDQTNPPQWESRAHFFGAAAEAMRRILIERARHKRSAKAGGNLHRQALPDVQVSGGEWLDDLLALDAALDKLAALDRRKTEVVKLRFFAGLTIEQVALMLGVSTTTVENDWAFARCWLQVEMEGPPRTTP